MKRIWLFILRLFRAEETSTDTAADTPAAPKTSPSPPPPPPPTQPLYGTSTGLQELYNDTDDSDVFDGPSFPIARR